MHRRRIILFLLVTAVMFPVFAAQADGDPVRAAMTISADRFSGPAEITVKVSVTNHGRLPLPEPVTLYDPDGIQVEDFGRPILGPGETVTWTGTWTVTQRQIDAGAVIWYVRYAFYPENGEVQAKVVGLQRSIGMAETVASSTPSPDPAAEYEAMRAAYGELPGCVITTAEEFERILPLYEGLAREAANNPQLSPWVCDVTDLVGGERPVSFTISAGSAEGVELLHPVVFMGGLVGWVEEVREHDATVRTILAPGSEIPAGARVNRDAVETTVRTETDGDGAAVLVTDILPEDCEIRTGWVFGTSGDFPVLGIPIGTVTGSERDPQGNGLRFILKPVAYLRRLSYVIVLRYHPGDSPTPSPSPAPTPSMRDGTDDRTTYIFIIPTPEPGE